MARPIEKGTNVLVWDKEWIVLNVERDGIHVTVTPADDVSIRRRVKVERARYNGGHHVS